MLTQSPARVPRIQSRTCSIAAFAADAALEAPLLALGYALAGTAFKDNGWAIEDEIQDTKNLAVYFRTHIAKPDRTILWAVSLGTIGALKSMEQFSGIFVGSLCLCAAGAGATRIWDNGLPLYLAYDVVFGVPAQWGTVGEVRNDIDFETEVVAKLAPELSNPANFPAFEFIRLVAGNPGRGLTPPPPPGWRLCESATGGRELSEIKGSTRFLLSVTILRG